MAPLPKLMSMYESHKIGISRFDAGLITDLP